MARSGSGTARIRIGDIGSLNSPQEWELRSDGRRLQRAFCKLEALQEARGADRVGREKAGAEEEKGGERPSSPSQHEAGRPGTHFSNEGRWGGSFVAPCCGVSPDRLERDLDGEGSKLPALMEDPRSVVLSFCSHPPSPEEPAQAPLERAHGL